MASQGHKVVSHTADVRVEAWGPSREVCIAEAVLGMVEAFVDTESLHPDSVRYRRLDETDNEDLLIGVLDEVIYLLDTEEVVPVDVELEPDGNGIEVRFAVVDAGGALQTGAVPKGVSFHGLRFGPGAGGWSCSVVVDV
ncbi:MAG: archease [Actinomycetota bacterium]